MTKEAVVVAHGVWMPGVETAVLRRRLRAAGFEPHLFRYASVRATLTENAERLARFAAALPAATIHLVGYSLGGVVAVAMLEAHRPPRGGRVVCLGSPLRGSRAGAGLARSGLGRLLIGRSVLELNERGGLAAWQGPAELGVIAGSQGLGIGRLTGVLPQPSDGTVAVAETRLAGAADHLLLDVTHTTMLFSREVAAQTVEFLRTGRFDRAASDPA
jgi:pimeloyl-ACP methyl ester carboxylesterase